MALLFAKYLPVSIEGTNSQVEILLACHPDAIYVDNVCTNTNQKFSLQCGSVVVW